MFLTLNPDLKPVDTPPRGRRRGEPLSERLSYKKRDWKTMDRPNTTRIARLERCFYAAALLFAAVVVAKLFINAYYAPEPPAPPAKAAEPPRDVGEARHENCDAAAPVVATTFGFFPPPKMEYVTDKLVVHEYKPPVVTTVIPITPTYNPPFYFETRDQVPGRMEYVEDRDDLVRKIQRAIDKIPNAVERP